MTGSTMRDGRLAARGHDGMAAFGSAAGTVTLLRHREIRFDRGPAFDRGEFTVEPAANAYDRHAEGGTTTLRFDARQFRSPNGDLVQDFVSLTGTVVNCAGGIDLRQGRWALTCPERCVGSASTTTKEF